jgi:hypothetical protein
MIVLSLWLLRRPPQRADRLPFQGALIAGGQFGKNISIWQGPGGLGARWGFPWQKPVDVIL